jgi:predicted XRE-type DNA-binding protein
MSNNRFISGWDAVENTREEAENVKIRSSLMMALKARIEGQTRQAPADNFSGI